ncbi:alpha/beta hydrolase [Nitriliruptoraceae bacterium ZYF776]|nr:alpha/beta hydrolase [Profundirhabdus halotolerans]
MLFLHNGGTSSTIWRHQIADLAADHRVVAVDLPGFGASPRPATPLDLDGLTDLVEALVDADGLTPVTLLGNCMGSAIAATLAARRPRDVRAMVLVNPLTAETFRAGGLGLLLAGGEAVTRKLAGPLGAAARRIRLPHAATSAVLRYQLGPAGARAGLHRDPELVACAVRPEQLPALTDVLEDLPASYRIARGPDGPPLCTIWGARNRVLSPREGARLDRALAPERRVLVRDTGHLPMLERPDQVTAAIRSFLDEVAAGAADREPAPTAEVLR